MWSTIATLSVLAIVAGACGDDPRSASSSAPTPPTRQGRDDQRGCVSRDRQRGPSDVTIKAKPRRIVSLSARDRDALLHRRRRTSGGGRREFDIPPVPDNGLERLRPTSEALALTNPISWYWRRSQWDRRRARIGRHPFPVAAERSRWMTLSLDHRSRCGNGPSRQSGRGRHGNPNGHDAIANSVPARGRPVAVLYELTSAGHSADVGHLHRRTPEKPPASSVSPDAAAPRAGAYPQLSNEFVLNATLD